MKHINQVSPSSENPHDIRCASSCTRAAITAFTLSALAIVLLAPLERARSFEALSKYINIRLQMKEDADSLQADPCWKDLVAKEGKAALARDIAFLKNYDCPVGGKVRISWDYDETAGKLGKPEPPRNVQVKMRLPEGDAILGAIVQIMQNDPNSFYANLDPKPKRAYYQWFKLVGQSLTVSGSVEPRLAQTMEFDKFRATLKDKKTTLAIPISEAIRLATHNVPDFADAGSLTRENRVALPSIPSPVDLKTGATLVELGLLFSVGYFLLFQLEAHRSSNYPLSGTLFSVVHRSRMVGILFIPVIILPSIAAVLLSVYSIGDQEVVLNRLVALLILLLNLGVVYIELRLRRRMQKLGV